MKIYRFTRSDYSISTDPALLDFDVIHGYLTRSYWSEGISMETVRNAAEHSYCFGVYHKEAQIGFARLITDMTSFSYLADVFILEEHRGQGLSKWLMECMLSIPEIAGQRKMMLATKDAHGLYAQYGFRAISDPAKLMELPLKGFRPL
jgi:GNAT superfamily N-acetyltransferase